MSFLELLEGFRTLLILNIFLNIIIPFQPLLSLSILYLLLQPRVADWQKILISVFYFAHLRYGFFMLLIFSGFAADSPKLTWVFYTTMIFNFIWVIALAIGIIFVLKKNLKSIWKIALYIFLFLLACFLIVRQPLMQLR